MQLYPGWSARDNYVGGSFLSGFESVDTCWLSIWTKGMLTATLNRGSEPFTLPTPGTISILSERQAGGMKGLVLATSMAPSA